jgi:hypothetical protein
MIEKGSGREYTAVRATESIPENKIAYNRHSHLTNLLIK